MNEQTIDITTKDGAMETFVVHPDRNGPQPEGAAADGRPPASWRSCTT